MSRQDLKRTTMLTENDGALGVHDDSVDLEQAFLTQSQVDRTDQDTRQSFAMLEANHAHEHISRRLAHGSTPTQILQGIAKAVGFAMGTLILSDDHGRLLVELAELMADNCRKAQRRKSRAIAAGLAPAFPKTWTEE